MESADRPGHSGGWSLSGAPRTIMAQVTFHHYPKFPCQHRSHLRLAIQRLCGVILLTHIRGSNQFVLCNMFPSSTTADRTLQILGGLGLLGSAR